MPPSELAATLEYRSGLLGLTGSADMQAILAAEQAGDADAALAVGVYLHRLRAGIAAMAAAMDGLDALVFTGGVGENSREIRARTAAGLGFLGIALDLERNAAELDAEIGDRRNRRARFCRPGARGPANRPRRPPGTPRPVVALARTPDEYPARERRRETAKTGPETVTNPVGLAQYSRWRIATPACPPPETSEIATQPAVTITCR